MLKTYTALVNSPNWNKTMLVITYDEHGGFYDHVQPPAAQDDSPAFRTYGVRVPALVVSPWTERQSVSNTLYDHTSLIKTILLRFCRRPDGQIPDMGSRVTNANHLGSTLTLPKAREPTPLAAYRHAVDTLTAWRADVFRSRISDAAEPAPRRPDCSHRPPAGGPRRQARPSRTRPRGRPAVRSPRRFAFGSLPAAAERPTLTLTFELRRSGRFR